MTENIENGVRALKENVYPAETPPPLRLAPGLLYLRKGSQWVRCQSIGCEVTFVDEAGGVLTGDIEEVARKGSLDGGTLTFVEEPESEKIRLVNLSQEKL